MSDQVERLANRVEELENRVSYLERELDIYWDRKQFENRVEEVFSVSTSAAPTEPTISIEDSALGGWVATVTDFDRDALALYADRLDHRDMKWDYHEIEDGPDEIVVREAP